MIWWKVCANAATPGAQCQLDLMTQLKYTVQK